MGRVRPLVGWRVLIATVMGLTLLFAVNLGLRLGAEDMSALLPPMLASAFFTVVWSRSLVRCDRNLRSWLREELGAVPSSELRQAAGT